MDKKTFDILKALKSNCVKHEHCDTCEYYFADYCILQSCPELWDMKKFIMCQNCVEFHKNRCLFLKKYTDPYDYCGLFDFKKDGD